MPDKLYKKLQRHASAPHDCFDNVAVGEALTYNAELIRRVQQMLSCKEPSCGQLILGKNGNGKTLLNKSIQDFVTKQNLETVDDGGRPKFDVIFSRISISQTGTSNIGVELAKALRRSYREPSDFTYASISAEILRQYSLSYKSPWRVKWMTAPAKVALKYTLKKYDEYIKDIIGDSVEEVGGTGIDKVFKKIDSWLNSFGLREDFKRFAREQKMSKFLEEYIAGTGTGYQSVEKLNKALYDDLASSFGKGEPQDIVSSLTSIGRIVGCRLFIFQIDDCNDPASVDFLLSIAENFEKYKSPKVLIIASAIDEVWEQNLDRGPDESAYQKVHKYFDPIRLSSPTRREYEDLANKLEVLIQTEEAEAKESKILEWPDKIKERVIKDCDDQNLTYRLATKEMIDSAVNYIR